MYAATTSVLVAPDGTCLVVDPGVTAREIAALAAQIAASGWQPVAVWSTHDHWDHRLDDPAFAGLPRWGAGSGVADDELMRHRDEDDELERALRGGDDEPPRVGPPPQPYPRTATERNGWAVLAWPGQRILVLEHDAHAAGHTALLLPEAGVLVAGDMLSDVEIPLLDESAADPVADYRAGLDALARTGAALVVPGHGTVGADLDARVRADLAYLDALGDPRGTVDARLTTHWARETHLRQHAAARRTPH